MSYEEYSSVVFIDANVVLECKKLENQPWSYIDETGPILLLIVPQVLKEIDNKKRDGRLAKHARDFNRLIAPAASENAPVRVVDGPPIVDIGLAVTNKLDWDMIDDLDPKEADDRVVAQILNERHTEREKRIFLSQDIYPLAMASRNGLRVVRIGDAWLRPPEPSPDQRKINKLESRVKELEATEPNLDVVVKFGDEEPFRHIVVSEPESTDKATFIEAIVADHPRESQGSSGMFSPALGYDAEYARRYDRWRKTVLPRFADALANDTNSMFAQTPVSFQISNDGSIQAEGLVITVKVVGGVISEKWNVVPSYPRPPKPETSTLMRIPQFNTVSDLIAQSNIGRHDMHFDVELDGVSEFEVHCQDFRHGRKWQFDGILTVDHKRNEDVIIVVEMTAANMRGNLQKIFKFRHEAVPESIDVAYDMKLKKYVMNRPMEDELNKLKELPDFTRLNLISYEDEN